MTVIQSGAEKKKKSTLSSAHTHTHTHTYIYMCVKTYISVSRGTATGSTLNTDFVNWLRKSNIFAQFTNQVIRTKNKNKKMSSK